MFYIDDNMVYYYNMGIVVVFSFGWFSVIISGLCLCGFCLLFVVLKIEG